MNSDAAASGAFPSEDEWKRKYEASLKNWLSNVTERQREFVASKPLIKIDAPSKGPLKNISHFKPTKPE